MRPLIHSSRRSVSCIASPIYRLHFLRNAPVQILHFTLSKVSCSGTSPLKGSLVWMLRASKIFPSAGLILYRAICFHFYPFQSHPFLRFAPQSFTCSETSSQIGSPVWLLNPPKSHSSVCIIPQEVTYLRDSPLKDSPLKDSPLKDSPLGRLHPPGSRPLVDFITKCITC